MNLTVPLTMLADIGDHDQDPVPVAIETPRGLLVAALRSTERLVYAINPMAVARYRERWTPARSKSDHADAMVLANILRTDRQRHRPLPADSELVRSIAVLARAHQDATWRRTKAVQALRSLLREYYPGFLDAFAEKGPANLASADARAVLAIAPTPADGARLTRARIAAALRRGGRQRNIAPVTDTSTDPATRTRDERVPLRRLSSTVSGLVQALSSSSIRRIPGIAPAPSVTRELAVSDCRSVKISA
ncbi:transposase [Rhodococcus erythropolis]|uniref:IS110 family transposase n=1 Tax=Rhodococcus erythropolis TaxID=1833 RepID=UPI00294A323B|nr:transposase [Rhodococcus erythropolis]MDV6278553.1 transposase [Rhodococcus erythropolis]